MNNEQYKSLTVKEFTKAAEIYDSDNAGIYEMCKDDYQPILEELEKVEFEWLLDVGCGTGPMIELLSARYPERHFVGMDITPRMIEVANEKGLANSEFIVGDSEAMPFDDEEFDAVICANSFHHYPEPQKFFNEVFRVLKPGGRLILRDYTTQKHVLWLMNHIEMPLANMAGHGDVRAYTKDQVLDMLINAGLKPIKLESQAKFRLHAVVEKPKEQTSLPKRTIPTPKAAVGTNSWGSKAYGKVLRGTSADEQTLKETAQTACSLGLDVFDTARDYGFGLGEKLIGKLCPNEAVISAKFTPVKKYEKGQVRRSFEKDLIDMGREYIDIYWLHLPNSIKQNLEEIISLYKEGRIGNIGVSNFSLDECKRAKAILDSEGISLYGVQNHYSIIARDWEKNGLIDWCRENGIQFWAWAVLEEGLLVPPKKGDRLSAMKLIYADKQKRLLPLYKKMYVIGKRHGLSPAQVAMSFCSSKGLVPVCGCRRAYQAEQLAQAVSVALSDEEISELETEADSTGVKILGADMFRFAVKKNS